MTRAFSWGLALGIVATALAAERPEWERYKVIVDRAPFGVPAAAGGPATPAPGWADEFRLVGLVPDPHSTNVLVILQDKQRAHLKFPGETIGDVRIEEVILAGPASQVVLRRGFETARLNFPDRATGVPLLPAVAAAGPAVQPTETPSPPPGRRRIPFRRGD
ncbi:MAG: hypothetical protein NZ483_04725 [Verrucomicrobiae bacterium]|nr:hypothetical protein [Verrucomicrobiae bacterium]MDW8344526.1 hypothetical protein [Verrucomicrobiae bacterium]